MNKKSLLFFAFSLAVILWCLNYIALIFYLYWTTLWYDILMHFMGGLTVAVLIIVLFTIETRSRNAFLFTFFAVMAIGLVWEAFEYLIDETFALEGYFLDTSMDLIMDALGAVSAYFLTTRPTSQSQESF